MSITQITEEQSLSVLEQVNTHGEDVCREEGELQEPQGTPVAAAFPPPLKEIDGSGSPPADCTPVVRSTLTM